MSIILGEFFVATFLRYAFGIASPSDAIALHTKCTGINIWHFQ